MTMNVLNVSVENLYVKDDVICYDYLNAFRITIDKMNYNNKFGLSYNHIQNFIVTLAFDINQCTSQNQRKSVNNLIKIVKYAKSCCGLSGSNRFVVMYIDQSKVKLYVNDIQLHFPEYLIRNILLESINNEDTVEYTFKIIKDYNVNRHNSAEYIPYIHEIKITNSALSINDINNMNKEFDRITNNYQPLTNIELHKVLSDDKLKEMSHKMKNATFSYKRELVTGLLKTIQIT